MKVDATAAGMDAGRLSRIDEHFTRRYIDPGKIAGCLIVVARHGEAAHLSCLGYADRERQRLVVEDTVWRLYSMTKPITGVALMTLYESGRFQLSDPVANFIPSWSGLKVAVRDEDGTRSLVDPVRPVTVRDVLMHTSGLGYGPANADLDVGDIAGRRRVAGLQRDQSLEELVERLAGEPLRFHPGTHWLYSFGTDVCARLVEVISGQGFDEYLQEQLFDPLGMPDTAFFVPDTTLIGSRPTTGATLARNSSSSTTRSRAPTGSGRRSCPAVGVSSRQPPTTSASARCSPTAANWTAAAFSGARRSSS